MRLSQCMRLLSAVIPDRRPGGLSGSLQGKF